MEDINENKFEGKKINNNENYNVLVYIDINKISFSLELIINNIKEKEFFNKFDKSQLVAIESTYENQSIEEIFDDLYTLLNDDKYEIINNQTFVEFIIKKNRKKVLKFTINIKNQNNEDTNINYENLSDEMKRIIDENELIIGIDLGTTYSCSCVIIDNNYIIIQNSLGSRTTPSYVTFLSKNKVCVGELAKLFPSFSKNIIYNVKRLIGRTYNNPEISNINLPFQLSEDNEFNSLKIKVGFESENKTYFYYPEQIYAMILQKIIKDSEYFLSIKLERKYILKI